MTAFDAPDPDQRKPIGLRGLQIDYKAWDSEFFEMDVGSLTWSPEALRPDAGTATAVSIEELVQTADRAGYELVECHVDTSDLMIVPHLESVGFRLVDSRIRFLTRWDLGDTADVEPKWGIVRSARPSDRDRLVELTHEGFTHNEGFVSRFKNPDYFTPAQTRRYFEAWIDSTAFADDAATAVFENRGEVVGYFIYQVRGEYEGLPVVKGILTAVTPDQRGADAHIAMQAFLYRRLGLGECYIENVTQLTNAPVIRNHVRSSKRYDSTALTFYRQPS